LQPILGQRSRPDQINPAPGQAAAARIVAQLALTNPDELSGFIVPYQ